MKLKHKLSFNLKRYGKGGDLYMIRLRASYNSTRLDVATGCSVTDSAYWDGKNECIMADYRSPDGRSVEQMNHDIRLVKEEMETAFKYFEATDQMPTVEALREKYNERMGLHSVKVAYPKTASSDEKGEKEAPKPDLFAVFDLFVQEEGVIREWEKPTFQKMASFKADLMAFRRRLKFEDINEKTLSEFVRYLREEKVLKTPRKKKEEGVQRTKDEEKGILNVTIEKKLETFRWFLNWATDRGYNTNKAYKHFNPKLKKTKRPVIFITTEELQALNNLTFAPEEKHLEQTRDLFLFLCFSGIRWSDMYMLRRGDVKEDCIMITTEKTEDSLTIGLNAVTKRILDKYKDIPFPKNKALPVQTNQRMNLYLKEICKRAGIDEPIRITQYRGQERIDTYKPKYELIGTHAGRRTFATQTLAQGNNAEVVMELTGHKDYRSMKPYIGVVNQLKVDAVKSLDSLGL